MKKKIISLLTAGIVALSITGFVVPDTKAYAESVQASENQEEFSLELTHADYSAPYGVNEPYTGQAVAGDNIRLKVTPHNGVGKITYEYHFSVIHGGPGSYYSIYSDSPEYVWTPEHGNCYAVSITARDEAGHSASVGKWYSITDKFSESEVPNPDARADQGGELKVNWERADYYRPYNTFYQGNAFVGDNIYFVANATGGQGKLTYDYEIRPYHGVPKDYIEAKSNSPVYHWVPALGSYQVDLTVTDEAGHSVEKSIFYSIENR